MGRCATVWARCRGCGCFAIPGNYYEPPPVICYVDRGQGAAIRRAKTRLPGGRDNPVAVIRIPGNAWSVPA